MVDENKRREADAVRPTILISMCLLGVNCRYDGGGNPVPGVGALAERYALIPVCPEQLGGLPTPRPPSERRGDRVVTREGGDVTAQFGRGAKQALFLAERFGARYALLKARSPSCGAGEIYDGTFTGTRIPGDGVTAARLRAAGIHIFDEHHIDDLIHALEGDDT